MEKVALDIRITLCRVLNSIYRNLQWHHTVSLRHHGFLVCQVWSKFIQFLRRKYTQKCPKNTSQGQQ